MNCLALKYAQLLGDVFMTAQSATTALWAARAMYTYVLSVERVILYQCGQHQHERERERELTKLATRHGRR